MQVRSVNDALLHVFQQVDFGALRAETLDDCALVGDDGIGRNVIVHQIVNTDFLDDDVRPGRHGGIEARQDPRRRVAVHALVCHGDLVASSPQRYFQLSRVCLIFWNALASDSAVSKSDNANFCKRRSGRKQGGDCDDKTHRFVCRKETLRSHDRAPQMRLIRRASETCPVHYRKLQSQVRNVNWSSSLVR
jgi:hypothetical protein